VSEILVLLNHVVRKQSVTSRYRVGSTGGGFGSTPPIDLDALELRDRLATAQTRRTFDLDEVTELAWDRIERPARLPLGECACGEQVFVEFDRVSAQCTFCGEWLNVADSLAVARGYVEGAWLTPAEVERETRGWGTPVRAGRVRLWRFRGQIRSRPDGRYRLADVLAVLDRQAPHAA
jgi:hypothetical protein